MRPQHAHSRRLTLVGFSMVIPPAVEGGSRPSHPPKDQPQYPGG